MSVCSYMAFLRRSSWNEVQVGPPFLIQPEDTACFSPHRQVSPRYSSGAENMPQQVFVGSVQHTLQREEPAETYNSNPSKLQT